MQLYCINQISQIRQENCNLYNTLESRIKTGVLISLSAGGRASDVADD